MKLSIQDDCENAPKKAYIRDFTIAFAKNDTKALLASVTDDIRWELVGNKVIYGKEAFASALEEMLTSEAHELVVTDILTHGDVGAIHGRMVFEGSTVAFCDICTFSSHAKDAKIKEMVSYGIEILDRA